MRHAIRIQPYLSRELFHRLRAYATAHSQTVSSVVANAVGEYLEPDKPDEDLLGRRLDRVAHALEQLGRDLNALAVGFGRFVQVFPLEPPRADRRQGRAAGRGFVPRVSFQGRGADSGGRDVHEPGVSDAPGCRRTADWDAGQ